MDYKQIIKDYMKQNRITYAALASRLGTSRQNVWSILNGRKNNSKQADKGSRAVSQEMIDKIMDILGLEVRVDRKK